jgi:hypothetical protein
MARCLLAGKAVAGDRDARRMLEGLKLTRKIGGNPALAQFELEIMPGAAVEDDQRWCPGVPCSGRLRRARATTSAFAGVSAIVYS